VHAQAEPRFRKRLPCRLKVAGGSHSAMVLNVSRCGLFVQTSAGPPPGASVAIDLDVARHPDTLPIGARVVWRRVVAPHLRALSQGGIGVRIDSAPEAYYGFLAGVAGETPGARPSGGPETSGPAPEARSDASTMEFRVRVKQTGGPRSRTLTLRCESVEEARARALAIVGSDWVILEAECSA
jgi:Tfp pilus assembly protein PilZ